MGYILFPLLVLVLFSGIFAVEKTQTQIALVPSAVALSTASGQQFVSYRDSVAAYLKSHPTFIGSVPSAALVAQGYQFSAQFLGASGNYISQVGVGAGRVIICYSNLPSGAINAALKLTAYDASFGIASGGYWTSYAPGAVSTPQPLASAVPNGNVVSVIQIGN